MLKEIQKKREVVSEELGSLHKREAELEEQLAVLEEMRELALKLNGQQPPKAFVPPARPKKARKQASRKKPAKPAQRPERKPGESPITKSAKALEFVLGAGRKVKLSEIAEAIGSTSGSTRQLVRQLVVDGKIDAEGATTSRVYFSKGLGDQEAREHTNMRRIPRLKERVLDAVKAEEKDLNEDRLAAALDIDREDIAVACGELLEKGVVRLTLQGTYTTENVAASNGAGHGFPDR